jgi:hypothetical protein
MIIFIGMEDVPRDGDGMLRAAPTIGRAAERGNA